MTALAGLLAGAAVLVLLSRPRVVRRLPTQAAQGSTDPVRRLTAMRGCVLAAVACVLLNPSTVGVVAGLTVALFGSRLLTRLEPRAARREREQLARDLPLAMDLLAACLAGGADQSRAAAAVAFAVGGPCGRRLGLVAGSLGAGSPPEQAWQALHGDRRHHTSAGSTHPGDPCASVARLLSRAAVGGAPVVATVHRLAGDLRAERRAHAEQAARRVGVLAVAPLGLCFLPAFVLLGVVPVVIGLAGPLLGPG